MNKPIDIVIPWVDGNDSNWIEEKKTWSYKSALSISDDCNSQIRYADWDNLKIWFRSIEKCLPWIDHIFFITWGHIPKFLKTDNPKLRIIKHDDYIPDAYLPTFNSNTIEMNTWRIKELSDSFILFNDDSFVLEPLEINYYFKNNMVCDESIETPIMPVDVGSVSEYACHTKANNIILLNKHFNKRQVQQRYHDLWFSPVYGDLLERNERLSYWNNFCGFHDPHLPNAIKKSTMKAVWEAEYEALDAASKNRFRSHNDISWFLVRYWQFCTGDFVPRRALGKNLLITDDNYKEIADIIRNRQYPVICLSEAFDMNRFDEIKETINSAFESIFPEKSSFEL
ncbi:stealth family protein [Butyrivibrio sp. MC2013]|uniref:stealth family protein n=1 Tax=Butyrivibrio sp. MC2013 TaxID=1280686 RepID=UPI0003FBB01B|nr:stealth family protein [Butyrivibrio sp. MC2013]